MRNPQLRKLTADDIDAQIDKILRGLGNPEPPLRIEDVRELMRLDTTFYTSTDASIFREMFSRAYVGTKQVFARPTLLVDALAKLKLRALWVPDRKRILIDKTIPKIKHRWIEAHEVAHSVLPWHDEALFGDTEQTLTPHCHEQLEGEANYGAGRLLFLGDRFAAEAADSSLEFGSVLDLGKTYGNTITSTLWRYIEELGAKKPLVGLISRHPSLEGNPEEQPCRYLVQSKSFALEFTSITEHKLFEIIQQYCSDNARGFLGSEQISLINDRGEPQLFKFETFYNGYDALTLGVHCQPAKIIHSIFQ